MKKQQKRIDPIGPKGQEINERMKELMGIKPINEGVSKVVVELTKVGPDGKAYAIIRENHEWFIKKTNKSFSTKIGKSTGLVAEDFQYIGGLMNKHSERYPSYAKAIKHLNLKFKSLAEAYSFDGEINVFANDNLLSETGFAGFSDVKAAFGKEDDKPVTEEKTDNVEHEELKEAEEEMSEAEKAIDKMIDEEGESAPEPAPKPKERVTETKLSISRALKNMDAIIDNLSTPKKKVYSIR